MPQYRIKDTDLMKMNSLSPEFHEWLRDGLGEAIAEDSPSISSYGSESFDEQMRRRPVPKAAAFSGTIRREKWLRPTGH